MNCLIVSPFENWSTGRGNRNTLIAEELVAKGHLVEFFTTNFDHSKKQKIPTSLELVDGIKVTTINVPGYKKNISFLRLATHIYFAFRLQIFLVTKKFDSIYMSSIPPEMLAIKQLKDCNLIIDVRDIWPDALIRYNKNRGNLLIKLGFFYLKFYYKNYLKNAKKIIVVADSYKAWVEQYTSKKAQKIPLGFRTLNTVPHSANFSYYFYAGGLTPQFDLTEFRNLIGDDLIVIAGSGPLFDHYKGIFPNIKMLGVIDKRECDQWLLSASILLFPSNPFACLPNKAFDYYASRKPIAFGSNISDDVCDLFKIRSSGSIQLKENYFEAAVMEKFSQTNCVKRIVKEIEES